MSEITGRDGYILRQALVYAAALLDAQSAPLREDSNLHDMRALIDAHGGAAEPWEAADAERRITSLRTGEVTTAMTPGQIAKLGHVNPLRPSTDKTRNQVAALVKAWDQACPEAQLQFLQRDIPQDHPLLQLLRTRFKELADEVSSLIKEHETAAAD